jgi:ribosomal protein L1
MAEQKAPRLSKRMKTVRSKVDRNKFYSVDDALKMVKETAVAKFRRHDRRTGCRAGSIRRC